MAQLKDTVVSGNLRVTDTVLADSVQADEIKKTGGTSSQFLKADGSVDSNTYALASAVSTSGTLNTNNSTAQTANTSEALSGTINLHKISKTGTYSDLIGTPVISSNIATDKADNTKIAGTKATYDEIHPAVVTSQPAGGFLPNVLYDLGTITGTVVFTMASPNDSTITNHYYWTFETSSTVPTITWPAGITSWGGGNAPIISASKHYEISVLDGVGCYMEA